MCELLGMSSNRVATLSLSLMKLAEHGGHTGPHKDGWGVAYYEGADVRLIKEAEAAADSDWVRFVRDHDLRSRLVIAHVRKASMGERAYQNTQPFMRELAGRMHLFAHNGCLPGIQEVVEFEPDRFHPVGETDSEMAFCALLERMAEIWTRPAEVPTTDVRMGILSEFADDLRALGLANFLYSDGDALFAHGDRREQIATGRVEAPGLVYLQRQCRGVGTGLVTSGLSIAGADQTIAIVASVPLSEATWQPLERGELIAFSDGVVAARSVGSRDSGSAHCRG